MELKPRYSGKKMIEHGGMMQLPSESGSAIVSVLSVIMWLSILVGIYWTFLQIQLRFIHRDAHRLQSEYVAEAGIYIATTRLQVDPLWETSDTLYTLADSLPGTMSVKTFGAFHIVRAGTNTKDGNISLRALIAEKPGQPFDQALYLWDRSARLNVVGSTSIYGAISTGRLGVRQNTLPRISYTGDMIGAIHYIDNLEPPHFSDTLIVRSMHRYDELIDTYVPNLQALESNGTSLLMPDELPIQFSYDDILITGADSLDQAQKIITPGNISLSGNWKLPEFTTLLAGGYIEILGAGSGQNLVFYGRNGISVADLVRCSAQLFSRTTIEVSGNAHLRYPSLLFNEGDEETSIRISENAQIDGIIIQSGTSISEETAQPNRETAHPNRIVIEDSVFVRGALFNSFQTELRGRVYGSVITRQFHLYHKPRRYINWLLDAEINHHLRPADFYVPPGFSGELTPISWSRSLSQPIDSLVVSGHD